LLAFGYSCGVGKSFLERIGRESGIATPRATFNLSQDVVESPCLVFAFGRPAAIRYLTDEGDWKPLGFHYDNGATRLEIPLKTMEPLVLRIVTWPRGNCEILMSARENGAARKRQPPATGWGTLPQVTD
jgi:hypothetical protein